MKKLFTFFLSLVASVGTVFAWDYIHVRIGDLYYNLDSLNKTAEVTYHEISVCNYEGLISVDIPSSIIYENKTYSVIGIGEASFCSGNNRSTITSVTIPNSVLEIGRSAFQDCSNLVNVTLGDNVNTIKGITFYGCSSLPSIVIPNSVTCIEERAFEYCENLKSIYLGSGLDTIGNGVFWHCDSLTNIYAPCGEIERFKQLLINHIWNDNMVKYAPSEYNINTISENGIINVVNNICEGTIVDAIPNRGYHFIQWTDGNTDNPRTIELTHDTTMEAIFDFLLEGKCGKDSVLVWRFDTTTMALEITGNGALSENYTYGTFIESLTIGNEVTSIGQSAFYGCNNLNNVIFGSSVKVLEESAFYYCSAIETITCYSQRPPTVNNYALYGLDYSTIVYVPADYLETYKMHDTWGLYDVRPIEGSGEIELETVNYIIQYLGKDNTELYNEVVTLHIPVASQIEGFKFLEWKIVSDKLSNESIILQAIYEAVDPSSTPEIVVNPSNPAQKLIRNGNVYILTSDHTYTLTGQTIK